MKSIAKKRPTNKKSAEKPLPKGRIEAAAKRAGVDLRVSDPNLMIKVTRRELIRFHLLLLDAQDLVIKAAPRDIVATPGWGMAAGLRAHDKIRVVLDSVSEMIAGAL